MSDLFEGCKPQFRIWSILDIPAFEYEGTTIPFSRNIALYLRIWPHWLIDMAM